MTAQNADGRDSRVQRIETAIVDHGGDAGDGQWWLDLFEGTGLLVLNPADEALVERIAFAVFGGSDETWAALTDRTRVWDVPNERRHAFNTARAVLAALAGDSNG